MDKEMLDIVNDLSKKPTTELALQIMELSSENLILEQQCKKQKEIINKAIEYINENLIISSILDGKKYYTISDYSFDYRELLDILNEVTNNE